ncbi:MAG: gliding motility-associated C-terminal domain-containing protein [Chitinophagales bacterium]
MNNKLLYLSLFILFSLSAVGGNNGDKLWYFGNSAVGLNYQENPGIYLPVFNQFTPYSEAGSAVLTNPETDALIFYTDGNNIINESHAIAASGLLANQEGNQSVVICKVPDQCNQYFVITNSAGVSEGEIRSTIVEVNLNNNGITIPAATKNQLVASNVGQGLEIIPKSSGAGYWLITSDKSNDELVVFEIISSTISTTPHSSLLMQDGAETIDMMDDVSLKFKASINRLAGVSSESTTGKNYVFVATFNASTGLLTNPKIITKVAQPYNAWDCEWAPDKSILYFSSKNNVALKQYDFNTGNITTIFNAPSNSKGGGLKCGVDKKIYHITESSSSAISVITSPNQAGIACNYVANANSVGMPINAYSFSSGLKGEDNVTRITSDTSLCKGDFIQLQVSGGVSYAWSPSDGLSCIDCANPICTVATTTTYSVVLTGNSSCEDTLQVLVEVFEKPTSVLPDKTTFCNSSPVTLDAGNVGSTYLWSNGSTTQTIQVASAGNYIVEITNSGGCSIRDTTKVVQVTTSNLSILGVLTSCESTLLSVNSNEGDIFWSTGDTTSAIQVTESGIYTVTLDNACGSFTDQKEVFIGSFLEPNFLGPDTTICSASYTLSIDAPDANVIWSDADVSHTKEFIFSNVYFVTVFNGGCVSSDTIDLTILDTMSFDLGPDIFSCTKDSLILTTGLFEAVHTWSSTTNTSSSILVTEPGIYYVTANLNGCSVNDSIKVEFGSGFENGHFIPDAFSPNGDSNNDCLEVFGDEIIPFHLQVFNRDGLIIFETTNQLECWDGNYKGSEVPQGVYFYLLETQDCFGNDLSKKGELILAR